LLNLTTMYQLKPSIDESGDSSEEKFRRILTELIQETCTSPSRSLERQQKMNLVVRMMQQSRKIWRGGYKSVNFCDYEEALQQTWLYFSRNLCEAITAKEAYNSLKGSATHWFNSYLKRRLQDIENKNRENRAIYLPSYLQFDRNGEIIEIDPVENLPAPPVIPHWLESIEDWLRRDKMRLLRIHLRDRPDINCYTIIPFRLPQQETEWRVLSELYTVPVSTLSKFYIDKCLPQLRLFLIDEEWSSELF
jgi:hypothetical protein